MVIIGWLVAIWVGKVRAKRFGLPPDRIIDLGIFMVIAGIVGARLVYVLLEWDYYGKNPSQIIHINEGGMTSFGGMIFGLLAMYLWCRRNKFQISNVLDMAVAPVLIAWGFGRIGCFLNGCCYGGETEIFCAVQFPGMHTTVHPAQLYDSAMNFFFGGLLLVMEKRNWSKQPYPPMGFLAAWGLIFFGVGRFVYESFRIGSSSEPISPGAVLTLAHIAAIIMFMAGAIWLLTLRGKSRQTAEEP